MSLYTPVFPSFEPSSPRKGSHENTSGAAPGKQQSYAGFLRDVHLFLSSKNDVLSPPSRPTSPLFDHRVQKVRDAIQDIFNAKQDQTSGKWARASQTLKLGCMRGRPWSVTKADPCVLEDTNWILPDEESEWIDWEKRKEESRRLKATTNAAQQNRAAASPIPGSQYSNHASPTKLNQLGAKPRGRSRRDVSPATLRAAKEKVQKWQASVAPELWHSTSNSSPASAKAAVAEKTVEVKTEQPQRSSTLDFAVVKSAARLGIGKAGRGPLSRSVVRSGSVPAPSHRKFSPSEAPKVPGSTVPVYVDEADSKQPPTTLPVKDDKPKIADVPETPYLPPSFPAHLETSTPLADSRMVIRAKPPPIFPLPTSSPTPPPSTPANPPEDRSLVTTKSHPDYMPSFLPPQINSVHAGKRPRGCPTSLDGLADDSLLTPPAKRFRPQLQNSDPLSRHSMSPNGALDAAPRHDTRDSNSSTAPSSQYNIDSHEVPTPLPLTAGKIAQPVMDTNAHAFPEKIPSPTKSIKSHFSAPDSDPGDSPVKANLLLESPVSPMLSYAQNISGFLPQVTSTQVRKESPTPSRMNGGILGMGYSSQFDIEKHVDRVGELLEKDVDFDGWLREVRVVETGHD